MPGEVENFCRIGVCGIKDPLTGDYKERVPLFVRECDLEKIAPTVDPFQEFAGAIFEKFREYAVQQGRWVQ